MNGNSDDTISQPGDVAGDAVGLEVFRHLLEALTEEMGAALRRTSFSPNIKERRDYSCALLDARGRPVALGDHMPVHLGAMPASVAAALEVLGQLGPGDVALLNDPFAGGTHLPDITVVAPVHMPRRREDEVHEGYKREGAARLGEGEGHNGEVEGRKCEAPIAWLAARAHHSDVGGMAPGSMPLAREIFQEGLRIPPVRLIRNGVRDEDLWRMILANVRTPEEREGDLDAQLAALHAGRTRLLEIVERRGGAETLTAMDDLIAYANRLVEAALKEIPDGRWSAEDHLEDDGFGSGAIPIRVQIEVRGAHMMVDFSGSSDQVPGGVNAVRAITASATRYVVRCLAEALLGVEIPAGGGSLEAVELRTRPGTVVDAVPPASVAAGNVETSQRITDVLLRALQPALPAVIPAMSQGTMNNLTVGGVDPRTDTPYSYYETMGGGMGGGPDGPGLSGVHSHMSNSLNTPLEALEHAYPFRVGRYALRRGSGGAGQHPGGEGLIRELTVLSDARVTLLGERRVHGPDGAEGGAPGRPGENSRVDRDGRAHQLPGKVTLELDAGESIRIGSPGGGGWGKPGPPTPNTIR